MDILRIQHTGISLAEIREALKRGDFDQLTMASFDDVNKKITFPAESRDISIDSNQPVYRSISSSLLMVREAEDDSGYYCGYAGCLAKQEIRQVLPPGHPGIPIRIIHTGKVCTVYLRGHFCSWECVRAYLTFGALPHIRELQIFRQMMLMVKGCPSPQEVTNRYKPSKDMEFTRMVDTRFVRECSTFSAPL